MCKCNPECKVANTVAIPGQNPTSKSTQCEVMIFVRGGVVDVVLIPPGITVMVRDYDVDGCEEDELDRDSSGHCYIETVHEAPGITYHVGDEDDGYPD